MQSEPIEVTLKVTAVFEQLHIPYLISGSLASVLYGTVRTTQDADIDRFDVLTESLLGKLNMFLWEMSLAFDQLIFVKNSSLFLRHKGSV